MKGQITYCSQNILKQDKEGRVLPQWDSEVYLEVKGHDLFTLPLNVSGEKERKKKVRESMQKEMEV